MMAFTDKANRGKGRFGGEIRDLFSTCKFEVPLGQTKYIHLTIWLWNLGEVWVEEILGKSSICYNQTMELIK